MLKKKESNSTKRVLQKFFSLNKEMKQKVIIPLSENPTRDSLHFFLSVIEREKSPEVKWYALKGIGKLKTPKAIAPLLNILKQPDIVLGNTSLHLIAARSIGQIGTLATESTIKLLEHSDFAVRRAAADTLGEIGDKKAIKYLVDSVLYDTYEVKKWAALSLAKIGRASLSFLHKMVATENDTVKVLCIDAILKIQDKSSASLIIELLENESNEIKIFILKKLVGFENKAIRSCVRKLLKSRNVEVQKAASEVLRR